MAESVQEFFDGLASRADAEKTAGMNNSYLFDIEGAGQWLVAVAGRRGQRHRGRRRGRHDDHDLRGQLHGDRPRRAEPDDGVHDGQAEDQGRHGRRDEAAEALLVRFQLDEQRAAGDAVALLDVHGLDRRVVGRRRAASPSSSPRARAAGGAPRRGRRARRSTLITVPGIGAVTWLSPPTPAWACAALSTSGAGAGAAGGRFSRQPPLQGASGRRSGGSESGGCSVRNAVVASPARTTGCATSQRRKGRFVVTPPTSVSARASREPRERLVARRPVRDQLRDHRVVAEPDLVAFRDSCIDPHSRRQAQPLDRSGLGEERARILGVEPHLDRVAL